MPTEVYENSIVLTHWGRIELDHVSNTAFKWDDYSQVMELGCDRLQDGGVVEGRERGGGRRAELQLCLWAGRRLIRKDGD